MVIMLVALTFAVAIVIDAVVVKRLAERRAEQMYTERVDKDKGIPDLEEMQDILFHEGHTWVRVKRAVVEIGLDAFTKQFVGDVTKIDCPAPGTKIAKGKKAWTISFGDRSLTQLAPISGMVFEVNTKLIKDPKLLSESPYRDGWIVKMLPDTLSQELPELYTPSRFMKWIDLQKSQVLRENFAGLGVVYGDGENLAPGAAMQIERDKWELVSRKLFGSEN